MRLLFKENFNIKPMKIQEHPNTKLENIKKSYYTCDVEPTLERLQNIIDIAKDFREEKAAKRLMFALTMKHMDTDEVEGLCSYISQARQKMESELKRVKKYGETFVEEYATDHNNYYNEVSWMLRHVRSHTSPLKRLFRKFCYRTHPNSRDMIANNIPSRSVFDESWLGTKEYVSDMYDLSTFPSVVEGLFNELTKFFHDEEECLQLCKNILEEEERTKKDPDKCHYLLDRYKKKSNKKLKNLIMLFSDDMINMLKTICPVYQQFHQYASENAFAQGEYHKHNTADMDHFCLIATLEKTDITKQEKLLWGDDVERVKKTRLVIERFDTLLPSDFKPKQMGFYQYVFCQWAQPNNIKAVNQYFIEQYAGIYPTRKYAAVNKMNTKYNKNSAEVKQFHDNISKLFAAKEQPMGQVQMA